MKTYDERHPFAIHTASRTTWTGDPARGSFTPKAAQKQGKRRKRR